MIYAECEGCPWTFNPLPDAAAGEAVQAAESGANAHAEDNPTHTVYVYDTEAVLRWRYGAEPPPLGPGRGVAA